MSHYISDVDLVFRFPNLCIKKRTTSTLKAEDYQNKFGRQSIASINKYITT